MVRSQADSNPRRKAVPSVTLALAALAGLALALPPWGAACLYERGLILQGQVWRLWTGHLAHFGPGHLGWNLAVLLPTGCWLEHANPVRVRWFYLVCPLIISLVLLVFDRSLARYAGLSGLAAGSLVLLACRQLRAGQAEPGWVWLGVLCLVAAKIAWETVMAGPLLAAANLFRAVPLAHLAGALCGLSFAAGLHPDISRRR